MTDNVAVLDGYTDEYMATGVAREFPILVKPGTIMSGIFRAWDMDAQEYVMIRGWEWRFTREHWSLVYEPDRKVIARFLSQDAAERAVAMIEEYDAESVHGGAYGIDSQETHA